jgi:hypothetical protein
MARAFSVSSFSGVMAKPDGEATAFNLNNFGYRRDVATDFPFDERVQRHGGCYVLNAHLRAAGKRIVYCPTMLMSHAMGDVARFAFVEKHFQRGLDAISIHAQDDRQLLKGTGVIRRFGIFGLVAISGRRILKDWQTMLFQRHQIGIRGIDMPVLMAMAVMLRSIELAGSITAYVRRDRSTSSIPSPA